MLLPATALPPRAVGSLLGAEGYCAVRSWFSADAAALLLDDARALDACGLARAARISQAGSLDLEIRRTKMAPLYPPPPNSCGHCATRSALYDRIRALAAELSSRAKVSLAPFRTELAYLYYPPGGFYRRHIDVPPKDGGWVRRGRADEDGGSFSGYAERRTFSFLLYLDPDWSADDGGALRVYPEANGDDLGPHVDVVPEAGTLVIFRSDALEHEVMPTHRSRHCIVGWFRSARQRGDTGAKWSARAPARLS